MKNGFLLRSRMERRSRAPATHASSGLFAWYLRGLYRLIVIVALGTHPSGEVGLETKGLRRREARVDDAQGPRPL